MSRSSLGRQGKAGQERQEDTTRKRRGGKKKSRSEGSLTERLGWRNVRRTRGELGPG